MFFSPGRQQTAACRAPDRAARPALLTSRWRLVSRPAPLEGRWTQEGARSRTTATGCRRRLRPPAPRRACPPPRHPAQCIAVRPWLGMPRGDEARASSASGFNLWSRRRATAAEGRTARAGVMPQPPRQASAPRRLPQLSLPPSPPRLGLDAPQPGGPLLGTRRPCSPRPRPAPRPCSTCPHRP